MKLSPELRSYLITAEAQFTGAVCAIMAESKAEAEDYARMFFDADPRKAGDQPETTAYFKSVLLATAKTAVRILEGT